MEPGFAIVGRCFLLSVLRSDPGVFCREKSPRNGGGSAILERFPKKEGFFFSFEMGLAHIFFGRHEAKVEIDVSNL